MSSAGLNFQARIALRYLSARKLRTVLTTLAVVIGVMLIFGMNGLITTMAATFRMSALASANQADLTVTRVSGIPFDAGIVDTVRRTPGVAAAAGSLRRSVVLPASIAPMTKTGLPVSQLVVAGIDPSGDPRGRLSSLAEGRFLQPGETKAVVIPQSLARQTDLKVGDTLRLPAASGLVEFTITGISLGEGLSGQDEAIIPLVAAQAIFNLPGQVNAVDVLFTSGVSPEAVRAAVLTQLGSGFKAGSLDGHDQLFASIRLGEMAIDLFGTLALMMGGFIIFNTFRTVVAERRRDIGMLRAVGASRSTIAGMILIEGLVQGIVGTALGILGGYLLVSLILVMMAPVVLLFIPRTVSQPVFSAQTFILSISLGLGVTVLAGLLPALAASRVSPLEALRPGTGSPARNVRVGIAAGGGVLIAASLGCLAAGNPSLVALGAVLFVCGLILAGPLLVRPVASLFGSLLVLAFAREGHLAQGNLVRQPGRAAITASAMMIGLAIVVALMGMISSVFSGFMGYIDRSLAADYIIMPQSLVLAGGNIGAGPELAGRIRGLPGIQQAASLRLAPTRARGSDLQLIGIDPVTYPQVSGLFFKEGDPAQAYAALQRGRAVIVNGIFAAQQNLHVGDSLPVATAQGEVDFRVAAIALDYLNVKMATAYISQADLQAGFHETSDMLVMANLAADADPAQVRPGLEALLEEYPAFALYTASEWRESQARLFDGALSVFYPLLLALALPSFIALLNTLAINVLERTREIGVLRAIGATRRQVRRLILAESLLLAAFGTACGILAGLWLSYVLVQAMNVGGFSFEFSFPAAGVLLAVAVALLFGVAAALIPARQAAKLEIVSALHYE